MLGFKELRFFLETNFYCKNKILSICLSIIWAETDGKVIIPPHKKKPPEMAAKDF